MKNIKTFLQGMLMGMAEVVPGVSGSTLAMAMGIYEQIIAVFNSIVDFAKEFLLWGLHRSSYSQLRLHFWRLNFSFVIPLGLGVIAAFALLSGVLTSLIDNYEAQTYAFFTGVLLISLWAPIRRIKKWRLQIILILIISLLTTLIFFSINPQNISNKETPSLLFLFIGGVLGIIGMVLPGISGGLILVVIGLYDYILRLVHYVFRLEITGEQVVQLGVFALGLATGFVFFVRVLRWLFNHYHDEMMSLMVGVILGSIKGMWPGYEGNDLQYIPFALIGGMIWLLLMYLLQKLGKVKSA